MAGHSQFKNIMYRKGAQDARRAKLFTKLIRELTVAARSGSPEPAMNPRLRSALAAAKAANMPKDTIERAIRRGAGGDQDASFEEVRYEGYGPGGVAIIVEALTDNRNRTAAETRTAFGKHGGTLGESGSVNFLFERIGLIHYGADDVAATSFSRRRPMPARWTSNRAKAATTSPAAPRTLPLCSIPSRRDSARRIRPASTGGRTRR